MQRRSTPPGEQLALALVAGLVLTSLAALAPAVANRLHPATPLTPAPTAQPTAPPAAVLLPEESERVLQGVMILVNDRSFGTAFQIDAAGTFLTASTLVSGAQHLRLVDNTGGGHLVRVVGIDTTLGLAEFTSDPAGVPLHLGDSATVRVGDPLVVLASQKVVNLRAATPAVVTAASEAQFSLRADDLPGEYGGPLVGPGGTVLGLLTGHGAAVPAAVIQASLNAWQGRPGVGLPLASLPDDLVLRGTDDTSPPVAAASITSVASNRAPSSHTTLLTLQGSGFTPGASLAVRFFPVASPDGAFLGVGPTVVSGTAVTVKVPAGHLAQDYFIDVTNGDGTAVSGHPAFTLTP